MCESGTWLNNDSINERFRQLLKLPFGEPFEFLFPAANQEPAAERARTTSMAILWQIRHNIAHNVGLLTKSDAIKLRLLLKGPVEFDQMFAPTAADLRYANRFLSEAAQSLNSRIGNRLALVLTRLHQNDQTLFMPPIVANSISKKFGMALQVDGVIGAV